MISIKMMTNGPEEVHPFEKWRSNLLGHEDSQLSTGREKTEEETGAQEFNYMIKKCSRPEPVQV